MNKRESLGRWLSVLSSIFQTPILLGLFLYAGIILQASQGSVQTHEITGGITQTLVEILVTAGANIIGNITASLIILLFACLAALPGFVLAIVTLTITSYRAKWFMRVCLFYAVAWLLAVPWGTLIGLAFLIVLFINRSGKKERPNKNILAENLAVV